MDELKHITYKGKPLFDLNNSMERGFMKVLDGDKNGGISFS